MYLTSYIPQIRQLCENHKVGRLHAFGSVLTERFSEESDVDLVVDFDGRASEDYFNNYFDFKYSLEDVLKRKVDLLEEQAIRNPYLRQSIDRSKQLIFGG